MGLKLSDDRLAQLLLMQSADTKLDEAQRRLDNAALVISCRQGASTVWEQAAVLTALMCAKGIFRGGVYLRDEFAALCVLPQRPNRNFSSLLFEAGCRSGPPPPNTPILTIGSGADHSADGLTAWADGWRISAGPSARYSMVSGSGNALSGSAAGALGVSEIFRRRVLGDVRAIKSLQTLNLYWIEGSTQLDTGEITLLPSTAWMLGAGNLGQALAWNLSLLPYPDPRLVKFHLQDFDSSGPENLGVQLLTTAQWLEKQKARQLCSWLESLGFTTSICERRFTDITLRHHEEPGLLFGCVDNVEVRRLAAQPERGFDLILDVGLGGGSVGGFDIRIHGFPGPRTASQAWPAVTETERDLPQNIQALVNADQIDYCGAIRIAGNNVGIPTTALIGTAIQAAQAIRLLETGECAGMVDLSLRSLDHLTVEGGARANSPLPHTRVNFAGAC